MDGRLGGSFSVQLGFEKDGVMGPVLPDRVRWLLSCMSLAVQDCHPGLFCARRTQITLTGY